jgi:hypothetical protein
MDKNGEYSIRREEVKTSVCSSVPRLMKLNEQMSSSGLEKTIIQPVIVYNADIICRFEEDLP